MDSNGGLKSGDVESYPSGEFEFVERGVWESLVVKFRMLFAYPWQRVKKGSVLTFKLRGQVCFLLFRFSGLFEFQKV